MNFMKKISWRRSDYEPIDSQESQDFGRVAFIICTYVLFREFHPIDSYLTPYLVSPPLNFSIEQVNEQIYPCGLLSSFVSVVVVFLITDYLRYKPVIMLGAIMGILTYALLLGQPSLSVVLVEQACYGFFFASAIAATTYLYAKVGDTDRYQKIASLMQSCTLFANFLRGIFSQLVMWFSGFGAISLVYVSTGGLIMAFIWSLFIPSVGHSIYFHRVEKLKCEKTDQEVTVVKSESFSAVIRRIVHDFKMAYTNPYVLKWCIWWGLSCGIYNLMITYSQVLWQIVVEEDDNNTQLMNGAVDSIFTLASALFTYSVGFVKFDWRTNADLILSAVSFLLAVFAQFMYWNSSLLVLYVAYICVGCTFQTMLTIAHSEVAQNIERDSYALIFGFNGAVTFGSSYLISFLFIQGWIVLLSTREQFLFYTLYFIVLGLFYLTGINWRCRKNLT